MPLAILSTMPNLLHLNNASGVFPDSYYSATAVGLTTRPPLRGQSSAEVGIIGGGYTGLSAALHLAKAGVEVAVLDAHRMGWGGSGRNGGQVATSFNQDPAALTRQLGTQTTAELVRIGFEAAQLVPDLAREYGIAAQYKPGLLYPNHRRRFDAASKALVRCLNDDYGYDLIRYIEPDQLPDLLGARGYSGATLDRGGGHIHPLNFALGLANAAEAAGARLYDASEVLSVDGDDPHLLMTAQGALRVKTLLYAGNGYLGALEPKTAQRVMPINSFIVATEPLEEALARSLIRDDLAVADSRFVVRYFRLSADRRLLFGGRESYGYRFHDDLKRFALAPMLDTFPQLRGLRIDYGWGGTLGITTTRLPYIAQLSASRYSLAGYSGSGVAMATRAGKAFADAVTGDDRDFEILKSLPTAGFPGGTALRSTLLFLGMHGYALRDWL